MQFKLLGLSKSYFNQGSLERKVFSDLDLEIEKGECIAIVGPSGSGKTTLLNIFGFMDKADSGEIYFNDQLLNSLSKNEELAYRNKEIGFVFQQHHLLPQCSIIENVLLPTLVSKSNKQDVENRAEELLNELGIWELRFQKPSELSVGECQRVAIARALINQPSVILADEPSGSLDNDNALSLTKLLIKLNKEKGVTLIVVTHSLELAKMMNKVYRFEDSKLVLLNSEN